MNQTTQTGADSRAIPACMRSVPAYEFLSIVGAHIYAQIAFTSKRDAIAYYNANAEGLKPFDSVRAKLLRKGKPWKDTWR